MKKQTTKLLAFLGLAVLWACSPGTKKSTTEKVASEQTYRLAIELILDEEDQADVLLEKLQTVAMDCYQWKNHIVLFGEAADTSGVHQLIQQSGIAFTEKDYNTPMYVFDRAQQCGDSTVSQPWRDYLLTANLVDDSTAQAEYMHYHAVQFDEWPEVAEGFCYAGFQQLLVFKTGRQLLLVISVPADKTLEELDPKTVENNPRMVEWNKKMGAYQEGIAGTAEGETWVFLQKAD